MKSVKQINLSKFEDELIKKAFEDLAHSTKYNETPIQSIRIFIEYEDGEEAVYKHSLKRKYEEEQVVSKRTKEEPREDQDDIDPEETEELEDQIDQRIQDDDHTDEDEKDEHPIEE